MSMVSTDPIADMLTRIRNAVAVNKNEVRLPHSNIKEAVASILKENDFLKAVTVGESVVGAFKELVITVNQPGTSVNFTEIDRLSRPGQRVYVKADEIPRIKSGRGIVIVSTSQGLMTGDNARKKRLGGELMCRIY